MSHDIYEIFVLMTNDPSCPIDAYFLPMRGYQESF